MRVLSYTKLDPNIPIDYTDYQNGNRWRAYAVHPTQPTVIGLRQVIDGCGVTKKDARENLLRLYNKIKKEG